MFDDFKYPEPDPNKKPAAEVWNQRYQQASYLFGKEPSLGVKNRFSDFKSGKVLDIGMGEGRNAVFLAKQGFQVEGIDCSSAGIEKSKKLAQESGVSIDAKVQNLDFFLMPLMKYDTIILSYMKPLPRFYSEIRRGLVMGGTFFLEAYLTEHYKLHSKQLAHLDFEDCYKPNEVLVALKDFHILYYSEVPSGDHHIVQALVRKK